MKSYVAGLVLLALPCVLPMVAQERQNFVFNPSTPEGQILQALGQEPDDARKVSLGQDFLAKFPKHEAAGWVAAQLEAGLLGQKEYDKVLDVAEMSYANAPDMDAAYYALKAAVAKEDVAQTKKWSARTSEEARKAISSAKPADDDDKHQLEYAKEVDEYSEYALYVVALKAMPKEEIDLVDTLLKQNPKSQYLAEVANSYFAALSKAGEGAKACPAAEKMAVDKNAEAMLYSADCSWRGNHAERVVSYAAKAAEAVNSRTKRDGVSDSDRAPKKPRCSEPPISTRESATPWKCATDRPTKRSKRLCRPLRAIHSSMRSRSSIWAWPTTASANRWAIRGRCGKVCTISRNPLGYRAPCKIRHRAMPS